jgi:hypothetical protein
MVRIVVSDAGNGKLHPYTFSVRWRVTGERQVTGELRAAAAAESGAVLGQVKTTWRSFSDKLGPFSGAARFLQSRVGDPDPPSDLAEIEMTIDELDDTPPISFQATRIDGRPNTWTIEGKPADWWARVTVYRDGVPIPGELTGNTIPG